MDKQKKYSLRKIAGIGLTSCVVGISVMNMPVQAEEGTDAAATAVSETVENAEATSPSENADETVAANNEATANESSTTAVEEEAANPVEEAAEQPAAEEEATSPAEEAASQPSETEEVAPASENIEAQPSNNEATTNNTAQPVNKDTELISDNGGLSVWYVSEKDKYSKSELGVQLTVDGKYYRNFWIKGSNGDIITPNQIQQATISDGIPKGYQLENNNKSYTLNDTLQETSLNLVRTNPNHEKVEVKFTLTTSQIVGDRKWDDTYKYKSFWIEKGKYITWEDIKKITSEMTKNLPKYWVEDLNAPHEGYAEEGTNISIPIIKGIEDFEETMGVHTSTAEDHLGPDYNNYSINSEEKINENDKWIAENERYALVNTFKGNQAIKSTIIKGFAGDTIEPSHFAKALSFVDLPEGYKFAEENKASYEMTGTYDSRQEFTFHIVPVHPSAEKGEFTITIKDKNGKVYGQKAITEPKGTALTIFEINNIAMELKEAATFPTGTDIDPFDLFSGKPYYYVGKDAGYDYILNATKEITIDGFSTSASDDNNTHSTDNKDPENNQNNTNSNGTTQPGNTSNDNGKTNTGGDTNNQTGENSSNTNQEGNTTTKPADNSDEAYIGSNMGGEPSEEDLKDPHYIKIEIVDENNVPHILGGFKRALGTTLTKHDIREGMSNLFYSFDDHSIDLGNDDAGDYDLVYNQEAYVIGKDRVISIRLVKKHNNTNGNGTTQPENTNNENGQTNTGGDTNNQTGENGTATNKEGNTQTTQNSNNNDKGQKPSKSDNSQSETAGLSRLAARKAKEDLPKAGMKENSLALLGFALFALTGGVSAKRVFRKK